MDEEMLKMFSNMLDKAQEEKRKRNLEAFLKDSREAWSMGVKKKTRGKVKI